MTDNCISWVHFGDLHIREAKHENYLDFLKLIDEVNTHVAASVDFAFLPGDNADDGTDAEYILVRQALSGLALPVHVITGDHDRKGGSLELFMQYLEPELYRAVTVQNFRLLFLNAMDGSTARQFDFSSEQIQWLESQLMAARSSSLRPLVFTHLYPSELATKADLFTRLLLEFQVQLVEMGHTHYNELANDGRTIYAATRSTGQIEEGPPGFSVTVVDGDVVSWKFKERGQWPLVMITSPADEKLITRPDSATHVLRGVAQIRAKIFGVAESGNVTVSIDGYSERAMLPDNGVWHAEWNTREVRDGPHKICVRSGVDDSPGARDEITVLVSQSGQYAAPKRSAIDFENEIGAYPSKGIWGTQLGPNENGTKGPWPSWRNS